MKNIATFFTILLFFLSSNYLLAQDQSEAIIGVWDTGKTKVEIYKVDKRFIGNPVNPNGERNEQIEILNLEYMEGKWTGKLYSKKKNKLFDVKCQKNENILLIEVDAGFITKEVEWTKVD